MTDDRPGLASRRFPGAVQELIATGDLPRDVAALVELERALSAEWFVCEANGQRLDQKGWPLRNEVELAHGVCLLDPALGPRDRALLATVRAWLDATADEGALHETWRKVAAVQHGSMLADPRASDEECLRVFAMICPAATESDRATFLEARRNPVQASLAPLVVQCAYEARSGWLMYHVHRTLASPSALLAADVIRGVVRAGGTTWDDVVRRAVSLVPSSDRAPEPRPAKRVLVLSDPLVSDWAHALEQSLDVAGIAPTGRVVQRYPTGDSLPALIGMASDRHDVVVVVIGAIDGNHLWMIKECAIRNLYPNVLLALAPGVPLPEGTTPAHDWIVPAPLDGALPHRALVARIERTHAER